RRKPRHFAARLIDHVAGKYDHRRKLKTPIQPLEALLALADRLPHALFDRGDIIPAVARLLAFLAVEADDLAGLSPHRRLIAPAARKFFHGLRVIFCRLGRGTLMRERLGE